MRTSHYLLSTLKETPADAELLSHKLMLRAGMIRKLSSGLYTWLPLGLRILQKVEVVVREEMNRSGAQEILLPTIMPADLWKETGRWDQYGSELLKITDRHKREFCYGPTHEEAITELARHELHSYKQLPIILYQIQTKFRDEIRPRFGVMRAREFLMKDAYSFHLDEKSLQKTYDLMFATYTRIFSRLGLNFRAVIADTGAIGGNISQEFQVIAQSGEDIIAYSDTSNYAANIQMAEAIPTTLNKATATQAELEIVDTIGQKTIAAVCSFLKIPEKQSVKTLLVRGTKTPFVALVLRGDHKLNETKAAKLPQVATPLSFANEQEVQEELGCGFGSLGPVDLPLPIIVDHSAAQLTNFVCGANTDGKHYLNANWKRDAIPTEICDLRNVVAGDPSPDDKGKLKIARGIEVGQIFQLGTKYSAAMHATVLNETGKSIPMLMGCYGIGISRTVAAAIEQFHDEKGIIWPTAMAPFQIAIVPIAMYKSTRVRLATETLYTKLSNSGYEVLLDDRNERPGAMFADMELIGIPHRLVISENNLDNGTIEYKGRQDHASQQIKNEDLEKFLREKL